MTGIRDRQDYRYPATADKDQNQPGASFRYNGPWSTEPDQVTWTDISTGYPCIAWRGPFGSLCGYVGIPPEHPWHMVAYNAKHGTQARMVESWIDVHGGVTFSGQFQQDPDGRVCHVPSDEPDPTKFYYYGFDCGHYYDLTPKMPDMSLRDGVYRDLEYVMEQCASMAEQLHAKMGLPLMPV